MQMPFGSLTNMLVPAARKLPVSLLAGQVGSGPLMGHLELPWPRPAYLPVRTLHPLLPRPLPGRKGFVAGGQFVPFLPGQVTPHLG